MAPDKDAAVLALIDPQQRILICRRADHLKIHAGESCLPGGKCDKGDANFTETALREAEEELGIDRSLVNIQYELPEISNLEGYLMHTVVGRVSEEPQLSINKEEVAEAMWVPLECFLKNENRWSFIFDHFDVHVFEFPQFEVFGLTANICILLAIRELRNAPQFDFNAALTSAQMAHMHPEQIIQRLYECFDETARKTGGRIRKPKL